MVEAESIANARPGAIITIGKYPHTAAGTDSTPIQWLVLENSGSELLVLSRYILDCRRYHTEFAATTWRDCDLRRWLHDEFYDAVFSAAEKRVVNTAHNTDNGEGSPDTDDKVFLLGVAAVHRATQELGSDFRRARGTEFAKAEKADGCHLYVMDKNVDADYITEGGTRFGCSWWWLRDQGRLKEKGNDPSCAAFVGTRASIRYYARVDLNRDGVRPAMRIDLSKG